MGGNWVVVVVVVMLRKCSLQPGGSRSSAVQKEREDGRKRLLDQPQRGCGSGGSQELGLIGEGAVAAVWVGQEP